MRGMLLSVLLRMPLLLRRRVGAGLWLVRWVWARWGRLLSICRLAISVGTGMGR